MPEAVDLAAMEPLNRVAAAQHLSKVAFHMSALAKLFDPNMKVTKAVKAQADAEAGKPPKPKREPTGYTLYIKDQMPAFKEQHPEMPQKERFKALAAQWQLDPVNPKAAGHVAAAAAVDHAAAGGEEGEARKEKKHKKHKKHDSEDGNGEKKHKKKHREAEEA